MSAKLKIKVVGVAGDNICEVEQARYIFSLGGRIVMVEGEQVKSYDDLVRLVALDKYRNKEFIELVLVPVVMGG